MERTRACAGCGATIALEFRFCPWCAVPQRRKLVEFFPAHAGVTGDRGKAVRASWYLDEPDLGSHVRMSLWSEDGRADAAVSLDANEAGRLARFLASCGDDRDPGPPSCAEEQTVALAPLDEAR